MYKQFKGLFSYIIPVIAFAIVLAGCKKKDVYPSQTLPAIKNVFPAEAIAGTAIQIKGTKLKDVVKVRFGTRNATGFNSANNTDTMVTASVPDSLPLGDTYVQVYFSDGTGYSAFAFKVLETPRVPDIEAADPLIAYPGDEVVIKGANLDIVTAVQFGATNATFTFANDKIRTNVPASAVGGKQLITLVSPNGNDTISFTVNLAPVITSISPNFGKVGDVITVNGVRFTGATSVKLGNTATTFTVVNDGKITFPVPAGALSGVITIVTPKGTGVSPGAFTVDNPNFKLVVFDDALNSDWEKWGGWETSVQDMANTEHPQSGNNAIKITWTGAYGGFQLHPKTSPLPGAYSSVKLSIYGGAGTAGKKVVLYIKNAAGTEHSKVEMTLTEGSYTTYVISLGELGNPSDIMEFNFQNWGTAPLTIYVDDMGFN